MKRRRSSKVPAAAAERIAVEKASSKAVLK
jgi:hypothetical protein